MSTSFDLRIISAAAATSRSWSDARPVTTAASPSQPSACRTFQEQGVWLRVAGNQRRNLKLWQRGDDEHNAGALHHSSRPRSWPIMLQIIVAPLPRAAGAFKRDMARVPQPPMLHALRGLRGAAQCASTALQAEAIALTAGLDSQLRQISGNATTLHQHAAA